MRMVLQEGLIVFNKISFSSSDSTAKKYTNGQITAFKVISILEIFLFSLLLALAAYNTFFFLYRQKRYRIYFISCFYGLAFLVIITRIALAVIATIVAFNYDVDYELPAPILFTFVIL